MYSQISTIDSVDAPPPAASQSPGLEAASKAVVPSASTATVLTAHRRYHEFMVRQWLEGYEKRGQHNPASDAQAKQFIEAFISRGIGEPEPAHPLSLEAESEKLAKDPNCTDPLVLTVAAVNSQGRADRVKRYERALAAYSGTAHRAYPIFYAKVHLMDLSKFAYDQEGELNTSALTLLAKCFEDGTFEPSDEPDIAEIFVESWGRAFFARNTPAVCDIVHGAGPGYQWLALVLDGERDIADAWKARGGGYANTVSDQGWQAFGQKLAQARKSLTQAWTLHPDYPLAPCKMMTVSLGDSGIGEMRTWFDRTLAAQIDYPDAWSNMRWGLRPRWYGSEPAMLAFGKTAVGTGRFDTDVPRKFLDSVSDLESEESVPAGRHLYGRPDIWPEFQRMYEGYIAEPSQAPWRNGWRTSYVVAAYFAGKYDVARAQLEALDWKPERRVMAGRGVDLSTMPLEVAARTGSFGGRIAAAESARIAGQWEAALKQYSEMASAANLDARSREFIERRCARLAVQIRLRGGNWVPLLPAKDDDPDWVYSAGDEHRLADGAVEVEPGLKGHMLFSSVPVGRNFEIRGRFEKVPSSSRNFQAGLVMGEPDLSGSNWYGFRIKRNDEEGDVVSLGQGHTTREIVQPVVLNDGSNSFDLTYQGGLTTASVNNDEVFHQAVAPAAIQVPDDAYLVGLGAASDSTDAVIRYYDVQVRQIN
jgi:hypothetical protein